jgi:sterol desaturase/sphingolipid hydroxylase (fatty acid hydroxylase superfamily)
MKNLHAEALNPFFKGLTFVNYAVILFFIYKFYKNYLKISTTATTKQLMQDILKARKTVRFYVYYNLSMIVLSFIAGLVIAFEYNPRMDALKYKIAHESNHHALFITIAMMVVFVAVFFGIFWLFYRLLYGTLLRKLHRNYKELQKIDL